MTQPTLFDSPQPRFRGSDYEPLVDGPRLIRQHERIRDLMLDGTWRKTN